VSAVDPRAIDLGIGFPTDPRITVGPDDGTSFWREVNN
jgi:hypothetical protein